MDINKQYKEALKLRQAWLEKEKELKIRLEKDFQDFVSVYDVSTTFEINIKPYEDTFKLEVEFNSKIIYTNDFIKNLVNYMESKFYVEFVCFQKLYNGDIRWEFIGENI